MTDQARAPAASTTHLSIGLLLLALLYGGMVTLAGVLGAKQVAVGPLAVEAGIFPFLTLVALSSAVAQLYGRAYADRFVRLGFIPLITAILLTLFALQLPTDPGMYPPAKEAFPVILGQSWRMMGAGLISYGVRPIADLILGQAIAKVVLSVVLVPALIALFVALAWRLDTPR